MTQPVTSSQAPRFRARNRPGAADQTADLADTLANAIEHEDAAEANSAPDQPDYAVGYGKPPVSTRFRPGRSGNPRGRPKGARGLNALVRETMTRSIPVRTAEGSKRMQRIEAVLHRKFELAMKGNDRAQSHLIDLYGQAIPESASDIPQAGNAELTPTDEAILSAFSARVIEEQQSEARKGEGDDQ